jgi:endonuclease III
MPQTGSAKRFAGSVVRGLARAYPDAKCALNFQTPLELLVATILSAQCTDQRVNQVTGQLFRKYRAAADYAAVPAAELEEDIRSTGFFRNKARNIQECCRILAEQYRGEVPRDLDALVALPGIGRKTANVVLGTAYGIASGVVVDTHVGRIACRLGLTGRKEKDAVGIEKDLMALVPQPEWVATSHRMIHHGRRVCTARKPRCGECPLEVICPRIGVART